LRILLIEDHERLSEHIRHGLEMAEFSVEAFSQGDEGLAALETSRFDAVVLDLGLPDRDGLDVLRALRARGDRTPVLILTSRIQVADRVKGLDAGADDYLTKPFAMEELRARLNAILRRPSESLGTVLSAGNLSFDSGAREARVAGRPLALTRRETSLLEHLLRRNGKVVPKDFLEDSLFGLEDGASANTVEVLVHRLRKKLELAAADAVVHTVRGVGYVLTTDAPSTDRSSDRVATAGKPR
jgi:DNA-binding response OmpR family regulator